jgi:hypothetical protein
MAGAPHYTEIEMRVFGRAQNRQAFSFGTDRIRLIIA